MRIATSGTLQIRGIRLTSGGRVHHASAEQSTSEPSTSRGRGARRARRRDLPIRYTGSTGRRCRAGWRLDEVHPAALAAADWILYSGVDKLGLRRRRAGTRPRRRSSVAIIGARTLLSFSLGTDSTAAMTLLPDDTSAITASGPYASYLTRLGARSTFRTRRLGGAPGRLATWS